MKKWFIFLLSLLMMFAPMAASSNASSEYGTASPLVKFSHYKDNIKSDRVVIEKFLYNEITGTPYTFDAIIVQDGRCIEVSDQIQCVVNDNNIIKLAKSNGIYAVKTGNSQVILKYQNEKKTYNIEVVDSIPLQYRLDRKNIILDSKGKTKLVQEFADMPDGTSIKINHAVKWESMDPNIATVSDEGLVCAESKGKTSIIATFGDIKLVVDVEVLDSNYNHEAQAFLDKMKKKLTSSIDDGDSAIETLKPTIIIPSLSEEERDNILNRCSIIFNTSWSPTQDLVGWNEDYTYKAGVAYTGLPYTQINHTDKDGTIIAGLSGYYSNGFLYALNNADITNFYIKYVRPSDNVTMPRYGTDCSGYVSTAFKIDRHTTLALKDGIESGEFDKVGSYDVYNPAKDDLLDSYRLMQRGDALVYRTGSNGHTFIVGVNYTSRCFCYEQTTYWTKLLWHEYEDLANSNYLPFSKK